MSKLGTGGFTIIELMVATSIFSVILLLCATALINIGNTYHKGIITSQSQNAARGISEDIGLQIKYGSNAPQSPNTQSYSGLTVKSFCMGETRYSYALDTQVTDGLAAGTYNSTKHQSLHAFWRDTAIDPVNCIPANVTQIDPSVSTGNITVAGVPINGNGIAGSGTELIPVNTRLSVFSITNVQGDLWHVNTRLVYGDEDLLLKTSGVATGCISDRKGGNFCAISDLNTEVYRVL